MQAQRKKNSAQAQLGFSLVEMLLTAFILAVGIMGLTMLQVMALKSARGGKSLSTAVQVGESVMDRIEMEGRLSWLNLTAGQYSNPAALNHMMFVNNATIPTQSFNLNGGVTDLSSPDPAVNNPFYTVNITQVDVAAVGSGKITDFNVRVAFSDATNPATNAPITRTVVLTRRVLHG
jgi:Tfp pilus assembly protein PilV